MWDIRLSTKFKKDLKRYQNQPRKIEELGVVLNALRETGTVPASYKPHALAGNFKGCMECHIEGDFLLIWVDEEEQVISLVRLGSHSELFK